MRLDPNPLFRKTIVAWYDSEIACGVTAFFFLLVFLFGMTGVSVVGETPAYRPCLWVPMLLLLLSGGGIGSIAVRLIHRWTSRFQQ
jgi:hypothetical protein